MAPSRALRRVCLEQRVCVTPRQPNRQSVCQRTTITSSPSRRAFSISVSRKADESTPKPASQEAQSFGISRPRYPRSINLSSISANSSFKPSEPRQPNPNKNQALSEETSKAIDNLLGKARANTPSSASRPTAYNSDTYASRGRTAASSSSPGFASPDFATNIMNMVGRSKKASAEVTGLAYQNQLTSDLQRENRIVLRLKPSLGRNVRVNSGADLTRAFQSLEGKINGRGNAVRRDERAQKFHVRAGQKKKIDRRARWRALFKQGYIAELTRVRKMIKQGW